MRGIYTYKITLSNTTSTATSPNLQVRLNINFSAIRGLSVDLGNIRFSSDQAGNNLLYAWLESAPQGTFTQGSSVSSYTSSNVWVNLGNNIIPANGSLNIYMQVLSSGTEFDGVYWGANPLWTSTYGQYDNGAYVFNNYWNFAGTSLPSGFSTINYNGSITVNNSITLYPSTVIDVYYNSLISTPSIVETYVVSDTNSDAGVFFSENDITSTPSSGVNIYNGYWGGYPLGTQEQLQKDVNGQYYLLESGISAIYPSIISLIWASTGNESIAINYANIITSNDTTFSVGNYLIGLTSYNHGANASVTYQWLRTRTYPPNGTDPVLVSIQILLLSNYISASIPSPEWTTLSGKPYITISGKGIVNGLSNIPNDGADFGPDTLLGASSPNQYGPPYTQTSGIQEAFTYLEPTGGYIQFGEGAFYLNTTATYTSEHALKIRGIRPNFYRGGPLVVNGTIFMPGPNWNETNGTPMLKFLNVNDTNNNGYLDFSGAGFIGQYLQPGETIPETPPVQEVAAFQCGNSTTSEGGGPVAKSITNMKISICRPAWWSYSGGGPNFYDKMSITGCGGVQLYDANIHMGMFEIFAPTFTTVFTIHNSAGNLPPSVVIDQIYTEAPSVSVFDFNTSIDGSLLSIGKINLYGNNGIPLFTQDGTGSVTIQIGNMMQQSSAIIKQNSSTNTPLINMTIGSLYSTMDSQIVMGGNSFASGSSLIINNFYAESLASGYTFTNFMIGNLLTIVKKYLPTPSPTLSANPPVSGTVYQNLNVYDIRIYLPAYATTSGTAGSVAIALGSSSSPSTIGTKFINGSTSSSASEIIELVVPAGWYYKFTATGVTFGTATVMPA